MITLINVQGDGSKNETDMDPPFRDVNQHSVSTLDLSLSTPKIQSGAPGPPPPLLVCVCGRWHQIYQQGCRSLENVTLVFSSTTRDPPKCGGTVTNVSR